ncbi:MAG: hypothetical protein AAEJ59_06970 [Arenicellales bacterium]
MDIIRLHTHQVWRRLSRQLLRFATGGEEFGDVWRPESGGGGGIVATRPRD